MEDWPTYARGYAEAAGVPGGRADEAVQALLEAFDPRHWRTPFPGAAEVLRALHERGVPIDEVDVMTFRPPVRPIPFATLAAEDAPAPTEQGFRGPGTLVRRQESVPGFPGIPVWAVAARRANRVLKNDASRGQGVALFARGSLGWLVAPEAQPQPRRFELHYSS